MIAMMHGRLNGDAQVQPYHKGAWTVLSANCTLHDAAAISYKEGGAISICHGGTVVSSMNATFDR
jgi:hypothetical protein